MLSRSSPGRLLALGSALAMVAVLTPTSALAAPVPDAELAGIAEDVLITENADLLTGAVRTRALSDVSPAVSPTAAGKLAARKAIQADRAFAQQVAGSKYTGLRTSVRVLSTSGSGTSRTAEVEETTSYGLAGSTDEYGYRSHHRVRYERIAGTWRLSDISAVDAVSEFSDAQLARVTRVPAVIRRAAITQRITAMGASLSANRSALRAGDSTKLANRRVPVAADDAQPRSGLRGATVAPAGKLGRPTTRPLAAPDQVIQPLGGEGPPYDYTAMVNFALYYATDHAVTYTRDSNDCTTFISWALWTGRYAEAGSDSYPAVAWNHDDNDVWYWRCNDCTPVHSYTWGGATNWNVFENNYGGRVTFLQYLDDLVVSDVMQLEIDGYGSADSPDHTMMVTGRGSDGWPLLSYHSTDTENKPFWDIMAAHDGPYWAART